MPRASLLGYSPFLYGIVEAGATKLVMAGTWLDQVRLVSPYWRVSGGWADRGSRGEAMAGVDAAWKLELKEGSTLVLRDPATGNTLEVKV